MRTVTPSGACRAAVPRRERGFVLMWFTILLVVMLGLTALAVDLGHAYLVKAKMQKAADAASLGGVVFLPGDDATAKSTAASLAGNNGYGNGLTLQTNADDPTGLSPTQLRVQIDQDVPTWFARIFGNDLMHVRVDATADYDQPVAMGSPANSFGNVVDCAGGCTTGDQYTDFWANVEGPDTEKGQGNAYTTLWCGRVQTDNCSPPSSYGNSDYDPNGYYYAIRNTNAGASLAIEIFDAPHVFVGPQCPAVKLVDDIPTSTPLDDLHNMFAEGSSEWIRYKPGSWRPPPNGPDDAYSEYCTGDYNPGSKAGSIPLTTEFAVLGPDDTPWTNTDNPVACPAVSLPGFSNAITAFNDPTTNARFRKWWTLCTISGAQAGDYLLRVTATAGAGSNQFTIRACAGSCSSGGVSVFGTGRMAIFANSTGTNNTVFYLARVLPGASGRVLNLEFFDIGDAPENSVGTLKVMPPTEATVDGNPLTSFGQLSGPGDDCTFTRPPGNSSGPPWGTFAATGGDCSISGVSSEPYNADWVQWKVPIPAGYSCNYTSSFGCWLRISFGFSGGVQDITTWQATLDGNPVRLIE